jgi:hypothetical protein
MVLSVPQELDADQNAVLIAIMSAAGPSAAGPVHLRGSISPSELQRQKRGLWDLPRCRKALDRLVRDGLAWIDVAGAGAEARYFLPSLFFQQAT